MCPRRCGWLLSQVPFMPVFIGLIFLFTPTHTTSLYRSSSHVVQWGGKGHYLPSRHVSIWATLGQSTTTHSTQLLPNSAPQCVSTTTTTPFKKNVILRFMSWKPHTFVPRNTPLFSVCTEKNDCATAWLSALTVEVMSKCYFLYTFPCGVGNATHPFYKRRCYFNIHTM